MPVSAYLGMDKIDVLQILAVSNLQHQSSHRISVMLDAVSVVSQIKVDFVSNAQIYPMGPSVATRRALPKHVPKSLVLAQTHAAMLINARSQQSQSRLHLQLELPNQSPLYLAFRYHGICWLSQLPL